MKIPFFFKKTEIEPNTRDKIQMKIASCSPDNIIHKALSIIGTYEYELQEDVSRLAAQALYYNALSHEGELFENHTKVLAELCFDASAELIHRIFARNISSFVIPYLGKSNTKAIKALELFSIYCSHQMDIYMSKGIEPLSFYYQNLYSLDIVEKHLQLLFQDKKIKTEKLFELIGEIYKTRFGITENVFHLFSTAKRTQVTQDYINSLQITLEYYSTLDEGFKELWEKEKSNVCKSGHPKIHKLFDLNINAYSEQKSNKVVESREYQGKNTELHFCLLQFYKTGFYSHLMDNVNSLTTLIQQTLFAFPDNKYFSSVKITKTEPIEKLVVNKISINNVIPSVTIIVPTDYALEEPFQNFLQNFRALLNDLASNLEQSYDTNEVKQKIKLLIEHFN